MLDYFLIAPQDNPLNEERSQFSLMNAEALPSRLEKLLKRLRWNEISENYLAKLIESARKEDLEGYGLNERPMHSGDVSTCISKIHGNMQAHLVAREAMVVCGLLMISEIFKIYGGPVTFTSQVKDGSTVEAGTVLGVLEGDIPTLLAAERVVLNFIQRLSGIASNTNRYVKQLGNSSTKLLDTRKTTPGWRLLEKYAVACGGGWNHRLGLFDRVMLKDNHMVSLFSERSTKLQKAVQEARARYPDLIVEVEVDDLSQIPQVIEAKPDVILLDNFSLENLIKAKNLISATALIEASGGVTLDNIQQIGQLGLDFISCGALTHQSTCKDIGLDCL